MLLPKSSRAEIEAMQWLAPHYVRDGQLSLSIYSFLVETPTRKLVVDTAVGNAKSRAAPGFNMLDTDYLDNFRSVWQPDDVDAVVSTHLHVDHVGWNNHLVGGDWLPTFPPRPPITSSTRNTDIGRDTPTTTTVWTR
jgi:glyoxylase-like metal-dependent hydrolase (beta-lactamase superfamily II)